MENLTDINLNPELAAWLAGLKEKVAEKQEKAAKRGESGDGNGEPRIYLPTIDMSKKFRQSNSKTYPEFQGSVSLLPVAYGGDRVTEINGVLRCWCPANDDWSYGFTYKILPDDMYPAEVKDRIVAIRKKLSEMLKSKKISWKECKRGSVTLILGLIINHRNTKNDLIASNLYGGDTLVEHKYVPALIICPNGKVQTAIQNDLDMKPNAVPYAMACYSNDPLTERKGWMSIKFTDATQGFGYDVTVSTELANPIVMPDGILPKDFNPEDERVKLLYNTDPVYQYLDWRQRGENGAYWNEESLSRLEMVVKYFEENK